MSEWGADPGQLDQIASMFAGLAGELDQRRAWLTAWIEGDRFWRGNRASEFRHTWSGTFAPEMSQAVQFLHDGVTKLHTNANEQRVASGEPPKDYGSGSFLHKLFGDTVHGIEQVGRDVRHDFDDVVRKGEHAVSELWSLEVAGFHEVVGSKAFAEVVGDLQLVSTVAGVVAIIPIPLLQEVAGGVALASGTLVMAGHLAQMANTGKFRPAQFAEDSLSVVGGGIAVKSAEAARAAQVAGRAAGESSEAITAAENLARDKFADGGNLLTEGNKIINVEHASGLSSVVKTIDANPAKTVAITVHATEAGLQAGETAVTVGHDLGTGQDGQALHDAVAGFGQAGLDAAGLPGAAASVQLAGAATQGATNAANSGDTGATLGDALEELGR